MAQVVNTGTIDKNIHPFEGLNLETYFDISPEEPFYSFRQEVVYKLEKPLFQDTINMNIESLKKVFEKEYFAGFQYFLLPQNNSGAQEVRSYDIKVKFKFSKAYERWFGLLRGYFYLKTPVAFKINIDFEERTFFIETSSNTLNEMVSSFEDIFNWLQNEIVYRTKILELKEVENKLKVERKRIFDATF